MRQRMNTMWGRMYGLDQKNRKYLKTHSNIHFFSFLTCVGLAFNFGKLMFVGLICKDDGFDGVGGNLRPLLPTNIG